MTQHICKLNQIQKSYPLQDDVQHIFSDLTHELPLDGITVLVGKSGCGKTTLLRLIAGLEQPNSGEITFQKDGKAYQPKIGMVFQESRLFPWMDVAENIFVSRETFEPEEALPYLKLVGLDARDLHSKPDALSGGMAHRVAIARGLAFEPDILLMDEPFAALDYFTRMSLQQKLLEIEQKTGTAIIFVTHHVDEALLLADRILVLDKGKAPIPLDISVAQPRHLEDPMMVQYKKQILDLLL